MNIFPAGLPQTFSRGSLSVVPVNNVIQTNMAVGPAKRRRRDVIVEFSVSGSLFVTREQYEIFEVFYNTTLGGGVGEFEWRHPFFCDRQMVFYFDHSETPYQPSPIDTMSEYFNLALNLKMKEM